MADNVVVIHGKNNLTVNVPEKFILSHKELVFFQRKLQYQNTKTTNNEVEINNITVDLNVEVLQIIFFVIEENVTKIDFTSLSVVDLFITLHFINIEVTDIYIFILNSFSSRKNYFNILYSLFSYYSEHDFYIDCYCEREAFKEIIYKEIDFPNLSRLNIEYLKFLCEFHRKTIIDNINDLQPDIINSISPYVRNFYTGTDSKFFYNILKEHMDREDMKALYPRVKNSGIIRVIDYKNKLKILTPIIQQHEEEGDVLRSIKTRRSNFLLSHRLVYPIREGDELILCEPYQGENKILTFKVLSIYEINSGDFDRVLGEVSCIYRPGLWGTYEIERIYRENTKVKESMNDFVLLKIDKEIDWKGFLMRFAPEHLLI